MYRPKVDRNSLFHSFDKQNLIPDLLAGATVAAMLIPQGMAYSMIAGLPVVFGLYASTIPLIIYALYGSSRHLAVGPVAMMSLIVFNICSRFASPGSPEYISYVLTLTLMVGVEEFLLGYLKTGFIANFMSHGVMNGFASAGAIIIGLSQIKHVLGLNIESGSNTLNTFLQILQNIDKTNIPTLIVCTVSILLLISGKKKFPAIPWGIVVVITGITVSALFRLENYGVKTVGEIPPGLPGFSIPKVYSIHNIVKLIPASLTLLFVGFMEAIAIAQITANKGKYRVDPNQELKALGLANLAGAFFSGYPVTGGLSRTVVNFESGAKTQLSSIFTALLIILNLLFLTHIFRFLPQAVLASIILVAVSSLFNIKDAIEIYRIKKTDGWVILVTFTATLLIGIDWGILSGVIFSLLLFIKRSASPHSAELGYIKDKNVFRDIKRYPDAQTFEHVTIIRIDSSLYFANIHFLEDLLERSVKSRENLEWVVLDFEGVNDMDAMAIKGLEESMDSFREHGITFLLAEIKGPVRDLMEKAGWDKKYGKLLDYTSLRNALADIMPVKMV